MRKFALTPPRLLCHAAGVCLIAAAAHAQVDRGDAAAAVAQPAQAGASNDRIDLAQAVTELGAEDVQTRIAAHSRLVDARSITLPRLEQVIRTTALTAEQRRRLLSIAYQRFLSEPRAGMGITVEGNGIRGTVLASLVPEFPASQVLRVGDKVVAAVGVTIDSWNTLRAVIISRDAGDEIPITVVRDGATLNLRVRLGRFENLRNAVIEPSIRDLAWELRSRELLDPAMKDVPPIESGLPASAWLFPGVVQFEGDDAMQLAVGGPPPRTGVVAGGESRGGVPQLSDGFADGRRLMPRDGRGRPVAINGPEAAQLRIQSEIQRVQILRNQAVIQLQQTIFRLADPTLDEQRRQAIQTRATELENEIRQLDADLQKLITQFVRP